jgi:hypothetical protein
MYDKSTQYESIRIIDYCEFATHISSEGFIGIDNPIKLPFNGVVKPHAIPKLAGIKLPPTFLPIRQLVILSLINLILRARVLLLILFLLK